MTPIERTNAIAEKVSRLNIQPIDILFVGATGVGKSSTLNALFGKNVSKVGDTPDPETMEIRSFRPERNPDIRIWDSPGLGDSPEKDKTHMRKIRNLLRDNYHIDNKAYGLIDLAVVILDGSSRDLGTARQLTHDILPLMGSSRTVFALNKCDMIMGGRHWDKMVNSPDITLMREIEERRRVFTQRIHENCGVYILSPVCYSAMRGYNIDLFLSRIISAIPDHRRRPCMQ